MSETSLSTDRSPSGGPRLTPTELAREVGLERREVITACLRLGVPIFNGRIDRDRFIVALRQEARYA